jgi:hypothetical protein
MRNFLTSPRYWGMRVHDGQVIGEGTWEPIITREQGERLVRLLSDPARRSARPARRYLLSGLLRCGKCGGTLHSAPKAGVRRYGCSMGSDVRGCGRIFIRSDMLEAFVTEAVLYRLDTPELLRDITSGPDATADVAELAEAIQSTAARMDDLANMFGDGDISRTEWVTARKRLEQRLEADRRTLARLTQRDAIDAYIGRGGELRERWNSLNLSRQVAIIKAVLDHAIILPAVTPGRHGLDPARIEARWRA